MWQSTNSFLGRQRERPNPIRFEWHSGGGHDQHHEVFMIIIMSNQLSKRLVIGLGQQKQRPTLQRERSTPRKR
jgi:hypothetical protein